MSGGDLFVKLTLGLSFSLESACAAPSVRTPWLGKGFIVSTGIGVQRGRWIGTRRRGTCTYCYLERVADELELIMFVSFKCYFREKCEDVHLGCSKGVCHPQGLARV